MAGVALGIAGAFIVARSLESLLFGVTPTDAAIFAVVSLLLLTVAAVGSYLPARRAARTDPGVSLRA